MRLTDTHSHLYAPEFDADREEALARAADAGVERVLLPAIDSESHERLFGLCRGHPERCVPMIGLHPTSVNDNPRWRDELALVESYLRTPPEGIAGFCAVGEIGLDLYWSRDFREEQAEAFVHGIYGSTGDNLHAVRAEGEEIRRNIVLITMESMSASYMERFGNTNRLTPVLDSLYKQGLAFDRVYATGNRTVRGLEAVTLSLPPCPGQSIIKRPNNAGMHSTGALLRDKGYNVTYFYGGNSYFDNMETFFSGNGYDIVDQKSYKPEEITFANIWGVCDEDAYRKVIRTLNEETRSGKPFFAHVMTVSNHRPFTYPAGRIRIPNDSKSRAGGVLYSDYSLGRFFAEAARQPWFENTIFLVTADHCASSAGRTEIPLQKYHIPALILAPGLIEPGVVDGIVSQIDLMPTLLSLLNMSYDSHFFGRSIYDKQYVNRAFIATYQDLGYLEGDVFTILSPVRRFEQYRVAPTAENPHNLEPMEEENRELVTRAVGYYQTSGEWNKR